MFVVCRNLCGYLSDSLLHFALIFSSLFFPPSAANSPLLSERSFTLTSENSRVITPLLFHFYTFCIVDFSHFYSFPLFHAATFSMYDFYPASPPLPATTGAATAPLFPACVYTEPYQDLFTKWGLLQPGAWSMQTYRYTHCRPSTDTGAAPSTAAALRFHHGVAADFLHALFACPAVQAQLQGAAGSAASVADHSVSSLRFRPLTCHWTTLEPLRTALVSAKVVRQIQPAKEGNDEEEESGDVRLPTVKCAEALLPHGEVISDELRAVFLQAHSRQKDYYDAYNGVEDNEEEEEEEEDDVWGAMSGSKLSLRQLRTAFDKAARDEFLYHLVWRLVAGSGPLNQFEDDAAVYLDAARQLYRALITSFHVRAVTAEVEEGDVTALEAPSEPAEAAAAAAATVYEAVVDACVYEVLGVPQLQLFPAHDGVTPSNLNYCYVVVNPSEQTACVWYHCC